MGDCLVPAQIPRHLGRMLNILSALIGLVTLILMIPAVFPLLGALNWILVPMALFGAFVGLMSSKKGGQYFCLLVAAFGALRLFLGGGII
jgi:hypothetical protein